MFPLVQLPKKFKDIRPVDNCSREERVSISSTSEEVQSSKLPKFLAVSMGRFPLVQLPKKFKVVLVKVTDTVNGVVSISSTSEEVQSFWLTCSFSPTRGGFH